MHQNAICDWALHGPAELTGCTPRLSLKLKAKEREKRGRGRKEREEPPKGPNV